MFRALSAEIHPSAAQRQPGGLIAKSFFAARGEPWIRLSTPGIQAVKLFSEFRGSDLGLRQGPVSLMLLRQCGGGCLSGASTCSLQTELD